MYKIKVFGTETMETEVILDEELYPIVPAFSIMSELEFDKLYLTIPKTHLADLRSRPPMAKTLVNYLYYDGEPVSLFLTNNELDFSIIQHVDWDGNDIDGCFEIETVQSPILYFNAAYCVSQFDKLKKPPFEFTPKKSVAAQIYIKWLNNKIRKEDYFFEQLEQAIIGTGSKGIILDNITSLHSTDLTVREYMRLYSRLNNLELKYGLSIIN